MSEHVTAYYEAYERMLKDGHWLFKYPVDANFPVHQHLIEDELVNIDKMQKAFIVSPKSKTLLKEVRLIRSVVRKTILNVAAQINVIKVS